MTSKQLLIWSVVFLAVVLDIWLVFAWKKGAAKRGISPELRGMARYIWNRLLSRFAKQSIHLKSIFPESIRRAVILSIGASLIACSLWVYHKTNINEFIYIFRLPVYWVCLLLGIGICIYIMPVKGEEKQALEVLKPRKFGLRKWQLGCLVLSPILVVSASLNAGFELIMVRPVLAIACWLAGIVLAILGSWPLDDHQRINLGSKRTIILVILLVAASLIIRGVNTAHIPIVFTGDEGSSGLYALNFQRGATNNIFRIGWFSFPSLFFFLQSISIRMFGQTAQALRLLSALAGALTVGAVYWLASVMFDKKTALFSAIFLAAYHFHNHFSRIGWNNIWDGLWYVIVLGCVWLGWKKERRASFIIAGLALGIAQYFYVTSRLLVVLILGWLLYMGIFDRVRFKRVLPAVLLMMLVALVTVFPLIRFYIRYPVEFTAPFTRFSLFGSWMDRLVQQTGHQPWQVLVDQLRLGLGAYIHNPIIYSYDPGTPLLRLPSAFLFCLGAGLLLRKPFDPRTILFAAWVVGFGFVVGLSQYVPSAQRFVAVAPALAIIVGYGLAEIVAWFEDQWPRFARVFYTLGVVIIVVLCVDELRFYFIEYTPRDYIGGDNTMVAQHIADYLQTKDASWEVLFFGWPRMEYHTIPSILYLAPQIEGVDILNPWGSTNNPKPDKDHLIFIFLPDHQDDLSNIRASFPGGILRIEYNYWHQLLFWLYEVRTDMSH